MIINIKKPILFVYSVLLLSLFSAYKFRHFIINKEYTILQNTNMQKEIGEVTILSFGTDAHNRGLRSLIVSSPYKINFLGIGNKFRSYRDKFEAVRAFLILHNLEQSKKVIMFIDGYDTLFTPGKQDILAKFHSFKKPLVLSAETNCYPKDSYFCLDKDFYPKSSNIFHYLNSGGYIGEAWSIFQMVSETLEENKNSNDDQYLAHLFFLKNPDIVALDYNQEIFSSLFNLTFEDFSYDTQSNRITNLVTNSNPVILHGNGRRTLLLRQLNNYWQKNH